jgi:hypothetical protein
MYSFGEGMSYVSESLDASYDHISARTQVALLSSRKLELGVAAYNASCEL